MGSDSEGAGAAVAPGQAYVLPGSLAPPQGGCRWPVPSGVTGHAVWTPPATAMPGFESGAQQRSLCSHVSSTRWLCSSQAGLRVASGISLDAGIPPELPGLSGPRHGPFLAGWPPTLLL